MHAGRHGYTIPLISLAPPEPYALSQSLPLDGLASLLSVTSTTLQVERYVIRNGENVIHDVSELVLNDGKWSGNGMDFNIDSIDDDTGGWATGNDLAYLETHIAITGEGYFPDLVGASFYTVYWGPQWKTFYNDSRLKYADPPTIIQVAAHAKWIDGYPASLIDPSTDSDKSVVVVNPYFAPISVQIFLEGFEKPTRLKVPPQSGKRIALSSILESLGHSENSSWCGQVYVSGKNRAVVFYADHSLRDPSKITTLEHGDAYRGELTHEPVSLRVRRSIGDAVRA